MAKPMEKWRVHCRPQPINHMVFLSAFLLQNWSEWEKKQIHPAQIGLRTNAKQIASFTVTAARISTKSILPLFVCVCVFWRFLCTKDAKMLCGKWDKCNNEIVSNRNGIKFIFSALSLTVRTKMRTDFRNGMNNPNETQLMRTICIVEIL